MAENGPITEINDKVVQIEKALVELVETVLRESGGTISGVAGGIGTVANKAAADVANSLPGEGVPVVENIRGLLAMLITSSGKVAGAGANVVKNTADIATKVATGEPEA